LSDKIPSRFVPQTLFSIATKALFCIDLYEKEVRCDKSKFILCICVLTNLRTEATVIHNKRAESNEHQESGLVIMGFTLHVFFDREQLYKKQF